MELHTAAPSGDTEDISWENHKAFVLKENPGKNGTETGLRGSGACIGRTGRMHSICKPGGTDYGRKELAEILNGFLEKLPVTQRRVFVCRYWYFDSVEDIAKRFGFGQSKVKMMLFRTRKKLKEILEKEGYQV